MSSETELKYATPASFTAEKLFALPEIAPYLGEISKLEMNTEYLDTPFSEAKKIGVSLRRRYENGKSLLYAKTSRLTSGELSIRGEWCVTSDDVQNAAELLSEEGAPTESLIGKELVVCGRVSFVRLEAPLCLPSGVCVMLSYDEGTFGRGVPFAEVELELTSGDADELLRFGRELSQKYGLIAESRSKYLRSLLYNGI